MTLTVNVNESTAFRISLCWIAFECAHRRDLESVSLFFHTQFNSFRRWFCFLAIDSTTAVDNGHSDHQIIYARIMPHNLRIASSLKDFIFVSCDFIWMEILTMLTFVFFNVCQTKPNTHKKSVCNWNREICDARNHNKRATSTSTPNTSVSRITLLINWRTTLIIINE